MKNTAKSGEEQVEDDRPWTLEEFMEVLQEELEKCELEEKDDVCSPLNFDVEANR